MLFRFMAKKMSVLVIWCDFEGCSAAVGLNELVQHQEMCAFRPFDCPHCNTPVRWIDCNCLVTPMDASHNETVSKQTGIISVPFATQGADQSNLSDKNEEFVLHSRESFNPLELTVQYNSNWHEPPQSMQFSDTQKHVSMVSPGEIVLAQTPLSADVVNLRMAAQVSTEEKSNQLSNLLIHSRDFICDCGDVMKFCVKAVHSHHTCEKCGVAVSHDRVMSHTKNDCPGRLVSCNSCIEIVKFVELQAHEALTTCDICGDEDVFCRVFRSHGKECVLGCGERVCDKNQNAHANTCAMAAVSCKFSKLGCEHTCTRNALRPHEEDVLWHLSRGLVVFDRLEHEKCILLNDLQLLRNLLAERDATILNLREQIELVQKKELDQLKEVEHLEAVVHHQKQRFSTLLNENEMLKSKNEQFTIDLQTSKKNVQMLQDLEDCKPLTFANNAALKSSAVSVQPALTASSTTLDSAAKRRASIVKEELPSKKRNVGRSWTVDAKTTITTRATTAAKKTTPVEVTLARKSRVVDDESEEESSKESESDEVSDKNSDDSENEDEEMEDLDDSKYRDVSLRENLSPVAVHSFHVGGNFNIEEWAFKCSVLIEKRRRLYFVPWLEDTRIFYLDYENERNALGCIDVNVKIESELYSSAVHDPVKNRIYFMPSWKNGKAKWYYFDLNTSTLGEYSSPNQGVKYLYCGGCYVSSQKRIYLAPCYDANTSQKKWHYIDCMKGTIESYSDSVTKRVKIACYDGAVYSEKQNKVFFFPASQCGNPYFHYVDCSTGVAGEYAATSVHKIISQAYLTGVYNPAQDRIYLTPDAQGSEDMWHYIDCCKQRVVSYRNSSTIKVRKMGYWGGAYSPLTKRIYFAPYAHSKRVVWHYIDCSASTPVVKEYLRVEPPASSDAASKFSFPAYLGALYVASQKRVYFSPFAQSSLKEWHYIQE